MSACAVTKLEADLSGAGLRIGIVRCRFNQPVGDALLASCSARLAELGVGDITVAEVPGALEAPLALQSLAARKARTVLSGQLYPEGKEQH